MGGTLEGGVRFRAPGPMHLARWMSKIIYSLKVWMLRNQFRLTAREERGLRGMCLFTVRVYVKAWTNASLAVTVPRQDLDLLKALNNYDKIDASVRKAALGKLSNHLWYLSEEMVCLSLFDHNLCADSKRKILQAMNQRPAMNETPKKITIPEEDINDCCLADFASKSTYNFLRKLNIDPTFFEVDPEQWETREDYQSAAEIVRGLSVTNDHAERGVALIQQYNKTITKDGEQLQFLLQVVSDHRKRFPDTKKSTLTETELQ